jgi:alpha-glucoside transport system substrate-binding protein
VEDDLMHQLKRLLLCVIIAATLVATGNVYADLKFPIDEDSRLNWDSYHAFAAKHDLSGQTLSIFGPWLGDDKALFESILAYFEEATGVNIDYSGSDSFEQQIVIDSSAGSAPNISVFPQPGLASDLAAKGYLTPLGDSVGKWVKENYAAGQSWVDLGSFKNKQGERKLYGFFYKSDVKSLVWYIPENFEEYGYQVPKSMEELKALTQQIASDGVKPWCIGLGSGGATGWPATDWVEDMMLRINKPDVYDKWVSNEIPFDDPRVIKAIDEFGWFARNPRFVEGGTSAVAATDFRDSPKGLFSIPPRCYMHKQASFIPTFFPAGAVVGKDVDFFYFPAYESKDLGKPVLGAGTMFAITKESEAAHVFIEFLETPIAHEVWMAQKGFLTPHKGVNLDAYANDTLRGMGHILRQATTFRFDGSDLMPGAIGAGAFWTGMIDYAGGKSAKKVAERIQESWDSIQ